MPTGTEGSGHGGWNREEGDEKGAVREREAQERGVTREELGQVEDNWISIVFFISPRCFYFSISRSGSFLFLLIPSLF
jgi:hypothetical protein